MAKLATTVILALAIGISTVKIAVAENADSEAPIGFNSSKVEYLVPDSPALSLSGVSAEKTLRPQSPKALVTDFRSAFDENGKLKNTLSVAFVPYLMLAGQTATLDDYTSKFGVRALSNLEMSLAAANGESSNDVDRYSAGLRWTVFDDGDPRIVTRRCVEDAGRKALAQTDYDTGLSDADEAKLLSAIKKCYEDWHRDHWNDQALDLGVAFSWAEGTSTLIGVHQGSTGVYVSWSHGVGKNAQFVAHGRYVFDQLAVDKSDVFFNQDQGYLGARFRMKIDDRMAFNTEAAVVFTNPDRRSSDRYSQLGASLEYKLADNLWLSISTSGKASSANEKSDLLTLGAIKWNFSDAMSLF